MVLANDDQALAAEPGFHGDPPPGGETGLRSIRRFSEHRSKPLEQQPENGLALAPIPAQALDVVMKNGATGTGVDKTPPNYIQAAGRCLNPQAEKPALRGAAILAAGSGGVHRPVPAKAVSRFACHSSPKRQTLADGLTWHGVQFEYADTSTL